MLYEVITGARRMRRSGRVMVLVAGCYKAGQSRIGAWTTRLFRNHLSGATSHTSVIPGLSHKASPKLVVQLAVIIG